MINHELKLTILAIVTIATIALMLNALGCLVS